MNRRQLTNNSKTLTSTHQAWKIKRWKVQIVPRKYGKHKTAVDLYHPTICNNQELQGSYLLGNMPIKNQPEEGKSPQQHGDSEVEKGQKHEEDLCYASKLRHVTDIVQRNFVLKYCKPKLNDHITSI